MKVIYILIVLLVAAVAVGCVDKTSPDAAVEFQPQTAVSQDTAEETDEFGMESDLELLDSMFNDSEMDISFEVSADAFT